VAPEVVGPELFYASETLDNFWRLPALLKTLGIKKPLQMLLQRLKRNQQ
jgi:hypothetical protein